LQRINSNYWRWKRPWPIRRLSCTVRPRYVLRRRTTCASVCLSVRLCVTLLHCVETAKTSFNRSTPPVVAEALAVNKRILAHCTKCSVKCSDFTHKHVVLSRKSYVYKMQTTFGVFRIHNHTPVVVDLLSITGLRLAHTHKHAEKTL